MNRIAISKLFLLLMGLINGKRAYVGPLFVDVDVTRRCNLKCVGCPYHDVKKDVPAVDQDVRDISLDLVRRLARELPILGAQGAIFCGTGEPLLHPRIIEIVDRFHQAGLHTQLFTNGILLNEKLSGDLVQAGLDRLNVSLWGSTPEEYSHFVPAARPGAFAEIVDNIKAINRIKTASGSKTPLVFLKHVCSVRTLDTLAQKVELALDTSCDGIAFSPYITHGEGMHPMALDETGQAALSRTLAAVRPRVESAGLSHNLANLQHQLQMGQQAWRQLPCYIAWYQTRIRADGAVMPCCYCNLLIGNLNTHTLKEIWNSPAYQRIRGQLIRRKGLAALQTDCRCDWCCYHSQNYRVHRIFKWVAPVLGLR